jgi:hypothetical protein
MEERWTELGNEPTEALEGAWSMLANTLNRVVEGRDADR